MAPRILRYEGGQERVMQVKPLEDAALAETRNMYRTISDSVSQMAKFSFEQEAREAKQRGMQRVADEGAQPVLSAMQQAGGPRNIEERAAVETANRIASAELETQAILEMNQVLSAAEQQELSLEDFQAKLADVTDGIPASLSDLNPLLAGELQAKLNAKAGIFTQNYADFYHKKAMQAARGRALVGIDTRQKTIYQLAASNSPNDGIRLAVIDAELKNLQFYMQDLQFSEDQVSKIFLETRGKAIEEGIRFDFSELGSVQEQMKFISKLEKSPPKAIGRDASNKIASTLRTQMNTGVKALKGQASDAGDTIKDLKKVLKNGGQISGAKMVDLETKISSLDGVVDPATGDSINVNVKAELQKLKVTEALLSSYREKTPAEAQVALDQLRSGIDGAGEPGVDTVIEVEAINAIQSLITNMTSALKKDAMTHAETVGLVKPSPLAFGGEPGDLINSIQKRRQDYHTVKNQYKGYEFGPLRQGEIQIVSDVLENGSIGEQMETLNTIAVGFREDAYDVFEQVSKSSPLMAHVGGLLMSGNGRAARMILSGRDKIKNAGPLPVSLGAATDANDVNSVVSSQIAGVFQHQRTEVRGAVIDASKAIFRHLISDMDPDDVNDDLVKQAVNIATGGDGDLESTGMGGVRTIRDRQVLVPSFMNEEKFENLLDNLTVEQIADSAGVSIDPGLLEEIKESDTIYPVAVGEDMYVLLNPGIDSLGKGNHITVDGEELTINVRELWLLSNNTSPVVPVPLAGQGNISRRSGRTE